MSDVFTQLGIGGTFAVLVIKIVLDHVKSRNGKKPVEPNPHAEQVRVGDLPASMLLECLSRIEVNLAKLCATMKAKKGD